MITPTVRFYLPDVLEYGDVNNISEILNHTHSHRVFFWYDKDELKQKEIKDFVDLWESVKHQNYKTHNHSIQIYKEISYGMILCHIKN